ncbi:MAG: hypothetical protein ACFFDN_15110 [Candidatus Hodarchaeota archaeon]
MLSLKNHQKSVFVFTTLIGGLIGLIFYNIWQLNMTPSFLVPPNSLNVMFVLVFFTVILVSIAIIYYMPRDN